MLSNLKDSIQRETAKRINDGAKRITELETIETPNAFATLKALNVNGLTLQDDGGNFSAKILDGGGFTVWSNGGKPDVIFETTGITNNCLQLQMTRPTATTVIRGLSYRATMVGRVGTVFTWGIWDVVAAGRNNQSIQYAIVQSFSSTGTVTVTAVTQTSTDLTLKFDCGAVTWTELMVGVRAYTPIDADVTFAGSLVA